MKFPASSSFGVLLSGLHILFVNVSPHGIELSLPSLESLSTIVMNAKTPMVRGILKVDNESESIYVSECTLPHCRKHRNKSWSGVNTLSSTCLCLSNSSLANA